MGAEELHSSGSNREEEVVCGFGGDRGILEGASWLGEKGIWEDPNERVAAGEEKEGVGLGLG